MVVDADVVVGDPLTDVVVGDALTDVVVGDTLAIDTLSVDALSVDALSVNGNDEMRTHLTRVLSVDDKFVDNV